jgi:hypothetical protein
MSKTQTDKLKSEGVQAPVPAHLKSERVQVPVSRLKSERVQSTVLVAEVAAAGGDDITVKVAGRRRLRSESGEESVADFSVKIK